MQRRQICATRDRTNDRILLGASRERARRRPISTTRLVSAVTAYPDFAAPRADGQARALFVSADQFADSVHGKASCAASTATRRSPSCRTRTCRRPPPSGTARASPSTKNCIACHAKAAQGYTETYHGQVVVMGFAHGATCADCHGSHDILRATNPASSVAPANLLKTCRKCHADATAGFATFQPHATTDDFAHYPYTWLASKFVNLAVGGVLLFFWIAFGALVLSRISRPPAAKAAPACARRRAAARRTPLLSALERDVALGAPAVRGQHHPAWSRPA